MSDYPVPFEEMSIQQRIRARRMALGLTQQQLAARVGTTQSVIAAIEKGARGLSSLMEQRLREALRATPAELVDRHRERIREEAAQLGLTNVRVFGSVARGGATEDSDLDLFVDYLDPDQHDVFDVFRFENRLENLLGIPVDVKPVPRKLENRPKVRQALSEAVAV